MTDAHRRPLPPEAPRPGEGATDRPDPGSADAAESVEPVPAAPAGDAESLFAAPSLPGQSASGNAPPPDLMQLRPGALLDDFQIQRVLGRGAFGTVYLALQLSLHRLVALKVARDIGREGRSMARLEHPNIVQVFAERVLSECECRLLCLQYVPGPNLQTVVDSLTDPEHPRDWTGADLLRLIDARLQGPGMMAPGDFQSRLRLEAMSRVQAVCLWGQELSDGLHFAHTAGILHHDIKPANILLSAHGRPLLADFNLAESDEPGSPREVRGGTLLYMAPETLADFLHAEDSRPAETPPFTIRQRADVYSLALVLVQLLFGRLPPPVAPTASAGHSAASSHRSTETTPAARRQPVPVLLDAANPVDTPDDLRTVADVLERACRESPTSRTESAGRLSDELRGCQVLSRLVDSRGHSSGLLRLAERAPFSVFLLLTLFPHFVGSVVNIAWNVARIDDLAVAGPEASAGRSGLRPAFESLTLWYNGVVWPLGVGWLTWLLARNLRAIRGGPFGDAAAEQRQRRRLLQLPRRMLAVAALGWLPGLLVFPIGLRLLADVDLVAAFRHFGVNLLMSGSIAFSYSWMGAAWMILSVCYLRLWRFPAGLRRSTIREETDGLIRPLRWCRTAAGLIPLIAAILIVVVSPAETSPQQYTIFRILLTTLIAVGMLGYHLSVRLTDTLTARFQHPD